MTAADGPQDLTDRIYKAAGEVAYICVLSVLWLVYALPVVTLPAATVGVYATLIAHLEDGGREYVRPFWRAFRASFSTITLPGLALMALAGLFAFNSSYYLLGRPPVALTIVLGVVQAVLALVAVAVITHLCGLAARFRVREGAGRPPGVKLALLAVRAHPWWSLLIGVVTVGVPAAMVWLGLWQFAFFTIGIVCYANAKILVRAAPWAGTEW